MKLAASVSLAALVVAGCATNPPASGPVVATQPPAPAVNTGPAPTAAMADDFVARAEAELAELSERQGRAEWVNQTNITEDTDILAAEAGAAYRAAQVRLASEATRFAEAEGLSFDTRRKLDLLKLSIQTPAADVAGAADELAKLQTGMQSQYGKGRGTYKGQPMPGNELEALMRTERNPELLKEMWVSWHNNVGRPMRDDYAKFVGLTNAGAKELGYNDLGVLWRSAYDMPPDEFAALTDRLWGEVKPLYDQLHCYVRSELSEEYGPSVQPATGPIRADLLGNMWAQEWGGIYDLVAPRGAGDVGYDLTDLLVARKYTAETIVKSGENFFSSLGFAPLPQTFWERSMITKPEGREVVCHASAWNIDNAEDVRIKMCTKVNAEDFVVVHHELGHNYYQRAYSRQPYLYKESANQAFHEAIGDTIALGVTPEYLAEVGLLPRSKIPPPSKDIGLLLGQAMDKVAFL
ncbi:MAG TPA: M2 family metallopeptidase, partial [Sphingomicrobium sp.]|nr:M2 family metallopeptidase [Sphingomicrobium sp.]